MESRRAWGYADTNILYVSDGASIDWRRQNGSREMPFRRIQQAIDAHGEPANAAEELQVRRIVVMGGAYIEDLVLPGAGVWEIVFEGFSFVTGDVSIAPNANVVHVLDPTYRFTTLKGVLVAWTGDWTITDGAATQDCELQLDGVHVDGGLDGTGHNSWAQCDFRLVEFSGAFNAPNARLASVEACDFDGAVTVQTYVTVRDTAMGTLTPGSSPTDVLAGLINCDIVAWGGGAGVNCVADGQTVKAFISHSQVIPDDFVPYGFADEVIFSAEQLDQQLTADVLGIATEGEHGGAGSGIIIPEEVLVQDVVIEYKAWLVADDDNAAETWTSRVRLGGLAGDVVNAIAAFDLETDRGWYFEGQLHLHTVGAAGEVDARAYNLNHPAGGAVEAPQYIVGAAIDTTGDVTICVTGECSTAHADNQVTLTKFQVQVRKI